MHTQYHTTSCDAELSVHSSCVIGWCFPCRDVPCKNSVLCMLCVSSGTSALQVVLCMFHWLPYTCYHVAYTFQMSGIAGESSHLSPPHAIASAGHVTPLHVVWVRAESNRTVLRGFCLKKFVLKFGAQQYLLRKLCSQAVTTAVWNRMFEGDCVQTAF